MRAKIDKKALAITAPLLLASAALLSHVAQAQENPRAFCARVGTDDQLRKPPPALDGALKQAFNIAGKYALETSYYRCADGKVMLCTVGVNLPCGKADTREQMPQANQWCSKNPNSDFIPMFVTGHDTSYNWHCADGKAVAGAPMAKIDAQGFFTDYWKELR